ncbi:methyl-accepting chemotaxis protein [Seleniivibrio sp.]|uniref:HAMP domain-containing methyl-accepting chemotaxis protein n=1 Tax=Seleniivibrio sp. TaxID=2898801 RepID=UPI0025FFD3DD|nr:methyl-accepting chemotaxis protein [Seleniivibrio sp.]MCD8553381.1 methyl-accepting chemotaxis protein [Seleniivibrio sp.]
MLKNMKLSRKLFIGFGIVLVLLTTISLLSFNRMLFISKLVEKRDMFTHIEKLLYDARLNQVKFTMFDDDQYIAEVQNNLNDAIQIAQVDLAKYATSNDLEKLEEITTRIKEYKENFDKYVSEAKEQKRLKVQLNDSAENVFTLADRIGSDDIIKNLLQMRLYAFRYLMSQSQDLFDGQQKSYAKAYNIASANPSSADMSTDIGKLTSSLKSYDQDFLNIAESLRKRAEFQTSMMKSAIAAQKICGDVSAQERAAMDSSISVALMFVGVFSVIAIFCGIIIGLIITKSVTVPMAKAVNFANTLSDGDFTVKLDINQKDEIGQFALALDNMKIKLHDVIEGIVHSSNTLASGSTELASTTEELASTFTEQTGQVNGVASAVEQISTSSSQVLSSINDVTSKSAAAKNLTGEGKGCIDMANRVMGDIQQNVTALSRTVEGLSQSSKEISSILLVINDIADQTNLLALNAAIEAARAGEHGRGFAVVADEVRKLAERTQQSISEIERIISSFVVETNKTNEDMQLAGSRVHEGVVTLASTDEIFEKIVRAVEEINSSSLMITTAVQEQTAAINNINDNTQVISSGLEQSSAALTQVSATVADLQRQADDQMSVTKMFRIN